MTARPGKSSSSSAGNSANRNREGQEDQLGALGLVLNAVILWNTRYIDAALTALPEQGVSRR
ncbi:Tn3 family transposase [Arthrobacter sp. TMN-49]